jgi:cysteine desulfurase family protein
MRVYLDNAATSWPKPEAVYLACDRYAREVGAAAGRGAHRHAAEAQRVVDGARQACAQLLDARDPRRIVWTANGTDALNLALHGILREGDRVVTTVVEHNSVLRPLADLAARRRIDVQFVPCDDEGFCDPDDFTPLLKRRVRLVAVSHASNVTGAVQDLEAVAHRARRAGALLLVDAAQTVGHLPWSIDQLAPDLVAASAHKGLLGPLGLGVLHVGPEAQDQLRPVRQGGGGEDSLSPFPPQRLPDRWEAGNLNVPALAGLQAAAQFLRAQGLHAIAQHERQLVARLREGLAPIPGVKVYGPAAPERRAAVVSVGIDGYDPQDAAAILDASFGVQCRAGLHCAPRIHQALGTANAGGLVRFSPGWSTSLEDVDAAVAAVAALAEHRL